MIVALIVVPCFIASVLMLFLLPEGIRWMMILPAMLGVGIFMIRHGINEWWAGKHPPALAEKEKQILDDYFLYYRRLGAEHKIVFEERVALFRLQKTFQMRGAKKLPGDIHLLVIATAVQLTMGFPFQKEFYPKLGTVIMYPYTFITPKVNTVSHAIEVDQDRINCLLLAVNMFVQGLQKPEHFYNIAIYGFAKELKLELGITDVDIPHDNRMELLAKLHVMRNFPIAWIFKYTGLQDFEVFEMCVEQFFCYPDVLHEELPKVYNYLVKVFKQDPRNYTSPAIVDAEIEDFIRDDNEEKPLNTKGEEPEAA